MMSSHRRYRVTDDVESPAMSSRQRFSKCENSVVGAVVVATALAVGVAAVVAAVTVAAAVATVAIAAATVRLLVAEER
jgi:hypothetical protein